MFLISPIHSFTKVLFDKEFQITKIFIEMPQAFDRVQQEGIIWKL